MAENKEASSCEDTEQSICVDGIVAKMEPLKLGNSKNETSLITLGNSKNETSLITNGAGKDNISKIVPSLPPEIIADILSRLPIKDITRNKIVSKKWHALTKDPHFADMHFRKSLCLARHLVLVPRVFETSLDVKTKLCLLNIEDGIWRGRDIPIENMAGNFVTKVSSCHGFMCVTATKVDPIFVYNPILREGLELPKTDIDIGIGFGSVGFGYDPINNKYKLVRFFMFVKDDDGKFNMNAEIITLKAEIITLGEASWRELEVPHVNFCNPGAVGLFVDDALHWIIYDDGDRSCDKVLAVDLSSEKCRTIRIPRSVRRSIRIPRNAFLLNLGGCLALIDHSDYERLYVWRIVNTKTGYKFYEVLYRMTIPYKHCICSIDLKDKLINNSFLFHVRCYHKGTRDDVKDHFAIYDPEQDQYRVLDVSGMPKVSEISPLIPSLVSPSAVLWEDVKQ